VRTIVAVVAHPDDEVLGCGATLAQAAANGDQVYVACLCECDRADELRAAVHELGAELVRPRVEVWLQDQRFEHVPLGVIAEAIAGILERHDPDVVLSHSITDLNLDHRLAAHATRIAARRLKPVVHAEFETLSSARLDPFEPNWWNSVSLSALGANQRALACYASQLQDPPGARNGQGLRARATATGSEVGIFYAESFRIVRAIS
jgi:LmbE family N-acetylglucosaminyl deacetylase